MSAKRDRHLQCKGAVAIKLNEQHRQAVRLGHGLRLRHTVWHLASRLLMVMSMIPNRSWLLTDRSTQLCPNSSAPDGRGVQRQGTAASLGWLCARCTCLVRARSLRPACSAQTSCFTTLYQARMHLHMWCLMTCSQSVCCVKVCVCVWMPLAAQCGCSMVASPRESLV